jgi:hypothetical protein
VTLGCFTATGVRIPSMIIFKGLSILDSHKQKLPTGSTVQMTRTSYINENVILKWLQQFKKTRRSRQIPVCSGLTFVSLLSGSFELLSAS